MSARRRSWSSCPPSSSCCVGAAGSISRSTRCRPCRGASASAWPVARQRRRKPTCSAWVTTMPSASALCSDLLINVTEFFRDPAVFTQLADEVLPDLLRGRDAARRAAHLVGRLRHRRGGLFTGHAGARRGGAPGLSRQRQGLRHRPGRRRPGPGLARATTAPSPWRPCPRPCCAATSSVRPMAARGSIPRCAATWCLRSTTCWATRRLPASTWRYAATC